MPRVPRFLTILPNHSVHKVWRGHNKEWNLGKSEDKEKYLEFLNDDFDKRESEVGAEISALCLMSNHTHEVFKVQSQVNFSNHMRRHHGRYGLYFNKMNGRSGKVAEDRPRTTLIEDGHHEMRTVFYIHANPIRAGIVKDARNYQWSTHQLYAFGKRAPWMKHIKLPLWYLRLGKTVLERQRKYRKLFAQYLKETGRFKQTFLKRLFVGNEVWVEKQKLKLSNWRATHIPSG